MASAAAPAAGAGAVGPVADLRAGDVVLRCPLDVGGPGRGGASVSVRAPLYSGRRHRHRPEASTLSALRRWPSAHCRTPGVQPTERQAARTSFAGPGPPRAPSWPTASTPLASRSARDNSATYADFRRLMTSKHAAVVDHQASGCARRAALPSARPRRALVGWAVVSASARPTADLLPSRPPGVPRRGARPVAAPHCRADQADPSGSRAAVARTNPSLAAPFAALARPRAERAQTGDVHSVALSAAPRWNALRGPVGRTGLDPTGGGRLRVVSKAVRWRGVEARLRGPYP